MAITKVGNKVLLSIPEPDIKDELVENIIAGATVGGILGIPALMYGLGAKSIPIGMGIGALAGTAMTPYTHLMNKWDYSQLNPVKTDEGTVVTKPGLGYHMARGAVDSAVAGAIHGADNAGLVGAIPGAAVGGLVGLGMSPISYYSTSKTFSKMDNVDDKTLKKVEKKKGKELPKSKAITKTGQAFEKDAIMGALGGGLTRGIGALGKFLKRRWKGALTGGISAADTVGGGISKAKELSRGGFGMRTSVRGGAKEFGKLYGQRPAGRRFINTVGVGGVGLGAYGIGKSRGESDGQRSGYKQSN